MDGRGWSTPRPAQLGILRSPHTPGTGSSVRFGMRAYDDGDESALTSSVSSGVPDDNAGAEPSADVPGSLAGDSMEMSFTESFLRREVRGALEGLDDSMDDLRAIDPPTTKPLAPAPDTVKAPKHLTSHSPLSSPPHTARQTSVSPPASPTIRVSAPRLAARTEDTRHDAQDHAGPANDAHGGSPAPDASQPASVLPGHNAKDSEPPDHSPRGPHTEGPHGAGPAAPRDAPTEPEDVTGEHATSQPSVLLTHELRSPERHPPPGASPAPERLGAPPATPAQPVTPEPRSQLARAANRSAGRSDASFASSSRTSAWATPNSGLSAKSPRSPGQWPGMYEFSYLSDKDELDEHDTGTLVPFAMEELSAKLSAAGTERSMEVRELLDMVAALDRTHTERTIFLQHRLARSLRLTQVLRDHLQYAQDRLHAFEEQTALFLERKAQIDTSQPGVHEELASLVAQLETQLATLRSPLAVTAPASPARGDSRSMDEERERVRRDQAQIARERAELDRDRADVHAEHARLDARHAELAREQHELETERRDLEVRLAALRDDAGERDAVAAVREACERDADVRVHMVRQQMEEQLRALRVQLAAAETQPDAHEELYAKLSDAEQRNTSLRTAMAHLEARLARETSRADETQQSREHAWDDERRHLMDACARVEARYDALCDTHARDAQRHEAEYEALEHAHRTEISGLEERVRLLEHDVSRRDLQLVQLQSQRDRLLQEADHFSLALYVCLLTQRRQGPGAEHPQAWHAGLRVLEHAHTARAARCAAGQRDALDTGDGRPGGRRGAGRRAEARAALSAGHRHVAHRLTRVARPFRHAGAHAASRVDLGYARRAWPAAELHRVEGTKMLVSPRQ